MKPERHMNLYINIFLCLKNIPGHHPPQQRLSGKRPCSYLHSMNQWRIWSWRFSLMSGPSVSFRSSLILTKASLYSSSCFICTLFLRWDSLSAWIIAALTSFNKGGGFWKYRPKGLRSWRLRCWWKILETNETCQLSSTVSYPRPLRSTNRTKESDLAGLEGVIHHHGEEGWDHSIHFQETGRWWGQLA